MEARPAKHHQIMRILRSRIVRGAYQGKLPGERALARELGTNPKTVQIALVRLESLGIVRRRQRMGTFAVPPDEQRRGVPIIYARLVLPSPDTESDEGDLRGFAFTHAFQGAARTRGIRTVLEYADDVDALVAEAVSEARSPGCIGSCIVSVPVEARHVISLSEARGPVVVADRELEEPMIPSVIFDDHEAGRLLAEHLVRLGHKHIAFIRGEGVSSRREGRLRGMQTFCKQAGVRLDVVAAADAELPDVLEGILSASPSPTAVVSADSRSADVLYEAASACDRDVPADLSLATFLVTPARRRHRITRVEMDCPMLGTRALEMLLDEDLATNPRRVLLPVKLADPDTTVKRLEE